MSYQLNSYAVEYIGHQRQQKFLREAEQFRLSRSLPAPGMNVLQRTMTKISTQIAEGLRTMTQQPKRMQGAS